MRHDDLEPLLGNGCGRLLLGLEIIKETHDQPPNIRLRKPFFWVSRNRSSRSSPSSRATASLVSLAGLSVPHPGSREPLVRGIQHGLGFRDDAKKRDAQDIVDVLNGEHFAAFDALVVVAGQQQVLLDRLIATLCTPRFALRMPRIRSESRTEETSGLVTTMASSAKYSDIRAPCSIPAGESQTR